MSDAAEHVAKSVTFELDASVTIKENHQISPSHVHRDASSPSASPSDGSSIPSPLVSLSRKQQLEQLAGSVGARIQQLGREEALQKIFQMKGLSPPKLPLIAHPPKLSPRRSSSEGSYRTALLDDAMNMIHKTQGKSAQPRESSTLSPIPKDSPEAHRRNRWNASEPADSARRTTSPSTAASSSSSSTTTTSASYHQSITRHVSSHGGSKSKDAFTNSAPTFALFAAVHPDAAHCVPPFASALKDVGGCIRCSDPGTSSPGAKSFCFDLSSRERFPLFAKPNLSVSFSSKQPSGEDVVEAGALQILRSAEERVCDILLTAMTNVPPVIVIEFGGQELDNPRIANMLTVLVDVLQRRLRSVHRTVVLLSLPATHLFSFITNTGARDVRIVGKDFFEQDYIAQSSWNFVSVGDGARLCAEAMHSAREMQQKLAQREMQYRQALADLSSSEDRLATVLASMIDIRDKVQNEKEQLSQRVAVLQEALALAGKAGFQYQLGFKQ